MNAVRAWAVRLHFLRSRAEHFFQFLRVQPVIFVLMQDIFALEARRLLSILGWLKPMSPELVPDNSLLREFIGNSILSGFRIWHNHNNHA